MSCYFSEASPTKTNVAKHTRKSTSAQLKRLHESSSGDARKLPAKIQATAVTTGATVKKAGSSDNMSRSRHKQRVSG